MGEQTVIVSRARRYALCGILGSAVTASLTSAQQRVAVNLNTHSRVEIERPAAVVWPHIVDPGGWKQGLKLSHHAGPAGEVGEIFAAKDPGRTIIFFVENVELVPNQRRTIKLYQPTGQLIGYATWTLEEANGRTGVEYDVFTETVLSADQPKPSAEALAEQERQGSEASKKRFDAELAVLKRLVEQESFAVTPDSVRLWYRVVGSGPETVIVPAALYQVRSLDALGRNRRLVLYDGRGRGRSGMVAPSKVSLENEFLDLETIRQAVGADSFALVSWSGAGLAHFVYALRHPGRVTRLVQLTPLGPRRDPFLDQIRVGSQARTDTAAQARLNARVAAGEFKGREAALCRELERIGGPTRFADPSPAHLAPDVCDLPNEWPERAAPQSRAMMASLGEYDWRKSLREVTIPRLVIHGERDVFPLEGSREWVAGQPNARLLIIPGAGHWPHYERREPTLAAIEEFLQGRWPAGSHSVAAAQPMLGPTPGFVRWAQANAIPMRPIDEPYADSTYDFLRSLIGDAPVLSLGEMIHGAHEPLELRNQVIRYAVTRLGFTAVAIESGFTEGLIVDRFVQGGPGEIDSVVRVGITSGLDRLVENRDLILWMRAHNARSERKVQFYGLDVPGDVGGGYDGAPRTPLAALEYLERLTPAVGGAIRSRLGPLLSRFTWRTYREYSPAEREQLRLGLAGLERALSSDSSRLIGASSRADYARAVRTAWNAVQLHQSIRLRATDSPLGQSPMGMQSWQAIRLRDSVMFENARWVLGQQGKGGRIVVFAHNGHSMNVPMVYPPMGAPMTMMGQRLRGWFGKRVFIIGTATSKYEGLGAVPHDMSLFEVALGNLGLTNYALDLRTAARDREVAAMLKTPWLSRIHAFFQPIVPRDVADVFVVFDRVTRSKDWPSPTGQ